MIQPDIISRIQNVFNSKYVKDLILHAHELGYRDSNPLNSPSIMGFEPESLGSQNIWVTVQTKKPEVAVADYHVWIRPLSHKVMVGTGYGKTEFISIQGAADRFAGGEFDDEEVLDDTKAWE